MQITAENLIWKTEARKMPFAVKFTKICTRSIRISDSFAVCFSRVSIQPSEDIKSIDTMSLLNGVYIGRDLMEIYF